MPSPQNRERIRVGELELAYRRVGSGPPLVLLHGAAADGRVWRPQLERLNDAFDVIAWDEPGAGGSSDPAGVFGISAYAHALAGLIGALGCPPAHVGGLSWGGTLALELYRLHPECVRSLILADTYAGWKGSLPQAECERRLELAVSQASAAPGDFAPSLPGLFGRRPDSAIVAELDAIVADTRPAAHERVAAAMASCDLSSLLERITVPTLLIWGEEDVRSPLSVAEQFRSSIPGAELVTIPNAGHVSNLEQPDRFNEAVRRFCGVTQLLG
jgi:pimeloyl-ACP methyl ester carboxylesterase